MYQMSYKSQTCRRTLAVTSSCAASTVRKSAVLPESLVPFVGHCRDTVSGPHHPHPSFAVFLGTWENSLNGIFDI